MTRGQKIEYRIRVALFGCRQAKSKDVTDMEACMLGKTWSRGEMVLNKGTMIPLTYQI